MGRSSIVVGLLAVSLGIGFGGPGVASQPATPGTESSPAACPATSEDENVAIARVWHEEVINNRNPEALRDVLAADIVHHAAGGYPETLDEAGVNAMMGDFLAAFPDLNYHFDFWVAQDDMVVERYTATGTHEGQLGDIAPTGRTATWHGVNIFRIECGRIAEVWSEVDAIGRNRQLTGPVATPAP